MLLKKKKFFNVIKHFNNFIKFIPKKEKKTLIKNV